MAAQPATAVRCGAAMVLFMVLVNGRTSAAVALAKVRSTARRPDPRPTDERLGDLLRQYKGTAQERMSATHTRQRNLVVMDTLSAQLDQVGFVDMGNSPCPC